MDIGTKRNKTLVFSKNVWTSYNEVASCSDLTYRDLSVFLWPRIRPTTGILRLTAPRVCRENNRLSSLSDLPLPGSPQVNPPSDRLRTQGSLHKEPLSYYRSQNLERTSIGFLQVLTWHWSTDQIDVVTKIFGSFPTRSPPLDHSPPFIGLLSRNSTQTSHLCGEISLLNGRNHPSHDYLTIPFHLGGGGEGRWVQNVDGGRLGFL